MLKKGRSYNYQLIQRMGRPYSGLPLLQTFERSYMGYVTSSTLITLTSLSHKLNKILRHLLEPHPIFFKR